MKKSEGHEFDPVSRIHSSLQEVPGLSIIRGLTYDEINSDGDTVGEIVSGREQDGASAFALPGTGTLGDDYWTSIGTVREATDLPIIVKNEGYEDDIMALREAGVDVASCECVGDMENIHRHVIGTRKLGLALGLEADLSEFFSKQTSAHFQHDKEIDFMRKGDREREGSHGHMKEHARTAALRSAMQTLRIIRAAKPDVVTVYNSQSKGLFDSLEALNEFLRIPSVAKLRRSQNFAVVLRQYVESPDQYHEVDQSGADAVEIPAPDSQ